jgi:antitoxin component YwqK of YwqJK toxin-antitoxin module
MRKLLLALPLLLFFACKKHDNNNNNNNNNTSTAQDTGCFLTKIGQKGYLQTYTWSGGQLTQYTSYDSANKSTIKSVYQYNNGRLASISTYLDGTFTDIETYSYQANAVVTNDVLPHDTVRMIYTLGSDGKVIDKQTYRNGSLASETKYTWANGNIQKAESTVGGTSNGYITYEYDNHPNPLLRLPSAYEISKNNVVKEMDYDVNGNQIGTTQTTYQYNASKGYPSGYSDNNYQYTYSYDCK